MRPCDTEEMTPRVFNAKAMSWSKDDNGFHVLSIRCQEDGDVVLVINCGAHQKRFLELTAPQGLIEENDCA